ncbi:MAG TPA: DUF1853 family protein [Burkholderiaceae bacterium]
MREAPDAGSDVALPAALAAALTLCDPYQAAFHRRWHHLRHSHARALAYLTTAPDLLDADAACWHGRLASAAQLGATDPAWLAALDRDDSALLAAFGERTYNRLGLYAEKLMAWYFAEHGMLHAHGVQLRDACNGTLGEFDYLLETAAGLLHIELATKFYLHVTGGPAPDALVRFVGPNLGDTLGSKMDKIVHRQLKLGALPEARAALGRDVADARAWVKGWLYYRGDYLQARRVPGIAVQHQRGYWCTLSELPLALGPAALMPKLQWLAPLQLEDGGMVDTGDAMRARLHAYFAGHHAPVQIAQLVEVEGSWIETRRGFVVPDGWPDLAECYARAQGAA